MDVLNRLTGSRRALQAWSVASLVANIAIIVTGAVVRLTGSGLGCPTWPECHEGSYTPHGAVSHHALIEFGNRTLTFVLIIVAALCLVSAHKASQDRRVRILAWVVMAGIPFQGVIGGITVLTDLNPYVVALHLLLSLALVVVLVKLCLVVFDRQPDTVDARVRALAIAVFVAMSLACWLGTVVTGSGPNAGDAKAPRTGLDIETVARVHAASVWVTVALTVVLLVVALRTGAAELRRWVQVLLLVEVAQGVLGYVQYFTGLPLGVVLAHMLGAGLSIAAAAAVWFSVRRA